MFSNIARVEENSLATDGRTVRASNRDSLQKVVENSVYGIEFRILIRKHTMIVSLCYPGLITYERIGRGVVDNGHLRNAITTAHVILIYVREMGCAFQAKLSAAAAALCSRRKRLGPIKKNLTRRMYSGGRAVYETLYTTVAYGGGDTPL